MFPRPLALITALALLTLPLAGCGIPGGVAYAIKEGAKEIKKKDGDASQPQQQEESSAAPAQQPMDANPPPAPVAAPRDTITVETLK